MENPNVSAERKRRLEMWATLNAQHGIKRVSPRVLRGLGIYGGAQGIWVDSAHTHHITGTGVGVTVSVLNTGRHYPDHLFEDEIVYHYPRTQRGRGRDQSE